MSTLTPTMVQTMSSVVSGEAGVSSMYGPVGLLLRTATAPWMVIHPLWSPESLNFTLRS
jgi:hypothetical protein